MTKDQYPLFSVCIATYNHERYLEQAIISVLSQSSECPIEILIGDDASTDSTNEIALRYRELHPDKIEVYRHVQNIGAAENYKFLISRARGNYICHLDGDDLWFPGKLLAQERAFKANNSIIACYTNAIVINDAFDQLYLFNNFGSSTLGLDMLLLKGNFLNQSSLIYRKEYRHCILQLPSPFIDFQVHLELAKHGLLNHINGIHVAYRWQTAYSLIKNQKSLVEDLYLEGLMNASLFKHVTRETRKHAVSRHFGMRLIDLLVKANYRNMAEEIRKIRLERFKEHVSIILVLRFAGIRILDHLVELIPRLLSNRNIRILHRV